MCFSSAHVFLFPFFKRRRSLTSARVCPPSFFACVFFSGLERRAADRHARRIWPADRRDRHSLSEREPTQPKHTLPRRSVFFPSVQVATRAPFSMEFFSNDRKGKVSIRAASLPRLRRRAHRARHGRRLVQAHARTTAFRHRASVRFFMRGRGTRIFLWLARGTGT